ncbi:hypothetical protein IIA16_00640 [bacterium]|nr:hypothetical protein [bacterium]
MAYWRQGGLEVDFVLSRGGATTAIEVKTGKPRADRRGAAAFAERFPGSRVLVVGSGGIPLEEFLSRPAPDWLRPS